MMWQIPHFIASTCAYIMWYGPYFSRYSTNNFLTSKKWWIRGFIISHIIPFRKCLYLKVIH